MAESLRARSGRIAGRPWLRRTVATLVLLIVALLLFLRFAAPGIIKSQGEKLLTEQLHRPTTIESVEIHPLKMAFAIHGLKMMEPDGSGVFASFATLAADISGQSILKFAPVIESLELGTPYVHLVHTAPGHYNIDDLLALASAPPAKPKDPKDDKPPRYSVYNIQVHDGKVEFDDRPEKTIHTIAELSLAVPFISSLASQVKVFVEPALHARIDDAPLDLKGKVLPYDEPREATLNLDFGALDLPRFVEYLPFQARFKVPSAQFETHLVATFSQPSNSAPTLYVEGTAALKALKVTGLDGAPMVGLGQLAVTLGKVDVFGDKFEITKIALDHPEIDAIQQPDGTLNLAQLAPPPSAAAPAPAAPSAPAKPAPMLVIDEVTIDDGRLHYEANPLGADLAHFGLKVAGTEIDIAHGKVAVHEVTSESAAFDVKQGKAAKATPKPAEQPKSAPATEPASPAAPSMIVTLGHLAFSNWTAHVEDRTMAKPVLTDLAGLGLEVHDFSTAPGNISQIRLAAAINKTGKIGVDGKVGIEPLHADLALDIQRFDILPLQPYFTDQINLLVTRGAMSTKGHLAIDQPPRGALKGGYAGDFSVAGLATIDKVTADPFLDWKSLAVGGIKLQLEPFSLSIAQVAVSDFFARVIIDPNGRLNLQDVTRTGGEQPVSLTTANAAGTTPAPTPPPAPDKTETKSAGGARTASATVPAAKPAPATPPPPIKVAKITLQGGRVRFTDNFIKPNYTANLNDLGGAVTGLSSDPSSSAAVDLRGQVNDAPLTIAGTVNPLSGNLFVDLKASVKGMELVPFTPYSGHYLGYGISKGKLTFDVAYKIQDRKLTASNRLVLDQLTFGDKIDSPTATSLPIRFAVSLLQDRNGVIDLDLPIGGSLDDPQFSIGSIIWHAFVNLIEKAVTAPFALLGSLFGGGSEQMSALAFAPGVATLPSGATDTLQKLSKALTERPQLKIEIAGHVDPDADREGLRRASIDRKVRALKLREQVDHGEAVDPETVTVSADEYPALLTRVYKAEKFPKPRNVVGLQKDLPVPEMEKLMIANATVSDADLTDLAQRRAQTVAKWLEKDGAIPVERVFVVAGKPDAGASNGAAPAAPPAAPASDAATTDSAVAAAPAAPAAPGAADAASDAKPASDAKKSLARVDFAIKS